MCELSHFLCVVVRRRGDRQKKWLKLWGYPFTVLWVGDIFGSPDCLLMLRRLRATKFEMILTARDRC